MKKYISVELKTDSDGAELFSALFFDFCAEGVEIDDPDDLKELTKSGVFWDYIDENIKTLSDTVTVKGYFAEGTDIDALKAEIESCECKKSDLVIKEQEEEDWSRVWREFYKPRKIGRLVIKPEWEEYKAGENEAVFVIEPGQAFGTGEHESTRMCLELAGEVEFSGKAVLDIGCGSGILGISAVLLGADRATLTDLDEKAVKVACDNAIKNGVAAKTSIMCADLSNTGAKFDIIFANLTADILIRLCKSVGNNLAENGKIIVSGIIDERRKEVLKAFESVGLKVCSKRGENGWRAYMLEQKK